jgi:hypothetical protein
VNARTSTSRVLLRCALLVAALAADSVGTTIEISLVTSKARTHRGRARIRSRSRMSEREAHRCERDRDVEWGNSDRRVLVTGSGQVLRRVSRRSCLVAPFLTSLNGARTKRT